MIEAGVPGYEAYTFNLILGPAGMPQTVIDRLDKASRQAMADPATIKFLEGNAAIPTPDTTPERTAQFIKDELTKWAPVIVPRTSRSPDVNGFFPSFAGEEHQILCQPVPAPKLVPGLTPPATLPFGCGTHLTLFRSAMISASLA